MNAEAVCGACGYSTIGLRELRCPECGGDLRSVGIYTPSTPRGRGIRFAGSVALFLVVFVAIAFMLTFLMIELLPQRVITFSAPAFQAPHPALIRRSPSPLTKKRGRAAGY